jgi:hypothetical protein
MDLHGLRPTPDASHRKAMILNKIIIVRTLTKDIQIIVQ